MVADQPLGTSQNSNDASVSPAVGSGAVVSQGAATSPVDPNVFSLEDLDKIIDAEDPDFKKNIETLKSAKLGISDDLAGLGVNSDDDHLTKDEDEGESKRDRLLKFITAPFRRIKNFFHMRALSIKNRTLMFIDQTIHFVRHEMPDRLRYLKSRIIFYIGVLKKFNAELRALPKSQKYALGFMTLAGIAALFFISKTLTGNWLPRYEDNLPRSLAKGASFVRGYQKKSELQDLFLAFPEVEYHVLLKHVVVNLKPTVNTGSTPMGTFEIFVGVDSQDTAVEVKDRERELIDVVQRALEGFTYDDCATLVGKSRMKEVIRDRLNHVLNQGRVFHIYFNAFVIYNGS